MKDNAKTFDIKSVFKGGLGQLTIPIIAIAILVIFNLFRDPAFFSIGISTNNYGNTVLEGNLISIINSASELAVLAIGMTLVTAACGGQDISVGAAAAIAGSVFVKVLKSGSSINGGTVALAFICACIVAMIFGSFNGTLVAVFKIQPMIATLILFTASMLGRKGSVRKRVWEKSRVLSCCLTVVLLLTVLIFGAYGIGYDSSQFIYNQF